MTTTLVTACIVCLLIGAAIGLFIGALLAGGRIHELQGELRAAHADAAAAYSKLKLKASRVKLETVRAALREVTRDDAVLIPSDSRQAKSVREA